MENTQQQSEAWRSLVGGLFVEPNIIKTIRDLAARSDLVSLKPFGLLVRAKSELSLSLISNRLLAHLIETFPLVLFRGFSHLSSDDFLRFCGTFPDAELPHWESGPVEEIKPTPRSKNYLLTREAVPLHWEGMFEKAPRLIAYQCLEAAGLENGGETLFCDTRRLWASAPKKKRAEWEGLKIRFELRKNQHTERLFLAPLVALHPRTGETVLRFAEPVSSEKHSMLVETFGNEVTSTEVFLKDMCRRIYSEENCLSVPWKKNDFLFADNHALIHGRRAFRVSANRVLRRIQIF